MDDKIQAKLKELFDTLPPPVQRAITSADMQKQLRALADTRKLHLDQWETLENEVQMALLGIKPIEDLKRNIQNAVGVSEEVADELAGDVSAIVFAPIREELERELEHPEAKAKEVSNVDAARTQMLADKPPEIDNLPPPTPVIPATPPSPAPTEKAVRGPASGAYKSGEASSQRRDTVDDPYREPPQ